MKKITFKVYKEAIIKRYEVAQKEDASGILSMPTPAQLRDFCSMKCDKGMSVADEELMKVFFETKADENLKRSIERCNIDKFRPVISFLKEQKDTDSQTRVGLAAILVDFRPRPYTVFLNNGKIDAKDEQKKENLVKTEKICEDSKTEDIATPKPLKRKGYLVIGIFILLGLGYFIKSSIPPKKQCMQWQKDHYEPIDCQTNTNSLYAASPIIPIDEDARRLNKLEVCDTTSFYEGKKAKIWYCKVNGFPEYFDGPGFHPVTGKALRPVTDYIIGKYVKQK